MDNKMFNKNKIAFACGLALVASSPLLAKETSNDEQVERIEVTGVRASLAKAMDVKRESNVFADALVAEDIGKFPDLNLAEALQRIPGITVSRTEGGDQSTAVGEASSINIRGLSSEFVGVSVNGIQAITPAQERGFSFNLLASELFSGAVVNKSLTAKDIEGGLAGTVKLSTYKPLDYNKQLINIGAKAVYNDLGEKTEPKFTALYVDQFSDNKFGIALGLAYSDTTKTEYMADTSTWVPLTMSMGANANPANGIYTQEEIDAIADLYIPRDPRNMANNRQQKRLNATFTLQGEISDNVSITWDAIYAKTDHTGEQIRNDYPIEGYPATYIPEDLQRDGQRFVSGTFPEQSHFMRVLGYEYGVDTDLFQTSFKLDADLTDALMMMATLGYADAEEDFHDWTDIDIRSANTAIFYEMIGDFVTFTPTTSGMAIGDVNSYSILQQIRNRPSLNKDKQQNINLDFSYLLDSEFFEQIDFGLHLSDRQKGSSQFEDSRKSPDFGGDIADYLIVKDFTVDGSPASYPTNIISIDYSRLVDDVLNTNPLSPQIKATSSFEIEESITAAYVMTNFVLGDDIAGNLGLRYVVTNQTSSGTGKDTDTGEYPVSIETDYNELLPSLNVKWDINQELVARFAAYRSLTRPNLTDIAPAIDVNFGTLTGKSGNPDINPFTAANYDIGLEWYFAEDAAFTVAYFQKELNGFVESATTEVQLPDPDGNLQAVYVTAPTNGKSAKISGFEIGFTSPFRFLPENFQGAGISLNATFTDSSAEFNEQTQSSIILASQLPGLSESSYNAILYYDADPVSVKLAYNWRTDYLINASGSAGQPLYRDDYGQLDFSAGYTLSEHLNIRIDALNLSNEQIRSFTQDDKTRTKGVLQSGRTFQLGLNYNF
jgi:iron complex outermembrane receptor protein